MKAGVGRTLASKLKQIPLTCHPRSSCSRGHPELQWAWCAWGAHLSVFKTKYAKRFCQIWKNFGSVSSNPLLPPVPLWLFQSGRKFLDWRLESGSSPQSQWVLHNLEKLQELPGVPSSLCSSAVTVTAHSFCNRMNRALSRHRRLLSQSWELEA